MKNKKISIILVSIIMLALAAPVFAADLNNTTTSGSTTITYGVSESYTVSIPASFNFTVDSLTKEETVSASNVLIADGNTLTVTMSSANYVSGNAYTLNYGTDAISKIPYSIKLGEADFVNAENVLTVAAGTTSATSEKITFATTTENIQQATKSGDHVDTLTFTVSVNDN